MKLYKEVYDDGIVNDHAERIAVRPDPRQRAPIVLLFVVFYFFLIRPQKKRDKAEKEMRQSIQVGDEISTIGGFIGKVVSIKDETLVIESSADRTKLKLYRWAVRARKLPRPIRWKSPKSKRDPEGTGF